MNKVLIVEGQTDQAFIEALIEHIYPTSIQLHLHYNLLDGSDEKKLKSALQYYSAHFGVKGDLFIGILLDCDEDALEKQGRINNALRQVFHTEQQFSQENQILALTDEIHLVYFLTKVGGRGNLDTLLKEIHAAEAVHANCLEKSWRECVKKDKSDSKEISDSAFAKRWLVEYIRVDTCLNNELTNRGENCNYYKLKTVLTKKKHIFNFDHPILDELKKFLRLFTEQA